MNEEKQEELKAIVAKTMLYKDYEEFKKHSGLNIIFAEGGYYINIYIGNTDFFYNSYTKQTAVYIPVSIVKNCSFSDAAWVEEIKTIVSRCKKRIKQQNLLGFIKAKAIDKIKKYISGIYNVEEYLIHTEDIHFKQYSTFTYADVLYFYTGTLAHKSFFICEKRYVSYQDSYKEITDTIEFLKQKQIEYDSKH